MRVGTVVDNRFRMTRLVGKGGTGDVYQGIDLKRAAPVAIKISHWSDSTSVRRFMHEAEALSRLEHEGVVRYVAHGMTGTQAPYVATEWLNGEDLGERLARGPLSVAETVAVGLQLAGALHAIHTRGVLHCDIKPGNLFLVDGDIRRIKLLDFGLARVISMDDSILPVRGDDELIGTRGYISPEQARGDDIIDQRADLYSLGVVLFSCLAQKPPFVASQFLGSLVRILYEVVPRVSDVREDVPPALDALIEQLMNKEPSRRLSTADILASALGRCLSGQRDAAAPEPDSRPRRARYWCVLVAGPDPRVRRVARLLTIASRHNASLVPSATNDTTAALFFTGPDLSHVVTGAACCASEVRSVFASLPLALANGRVSLGHPVPVTTVIDQAAQLWQAGEPEPTPVPVYPPAAGERSQGPSVRPQSLAIETTEFRQPAGEDAPAPGPASSSSPRDVAAGRLTRMAGRDRELAALASLVDESIAGHTARAALLLGEPGVGKSRLAHELIKQVETREVATSVWTSVGDPVHACEPFGLLERLVSHPGATRPTVPPAGSPRDPDRQGAWLAWLAARLAAGPVMLVLDDCQWADAPSLCAAQAALRELAAYPLVIIALARPTCQGRGPAAWPLSGCQELLLAPLSEPASEELARHALASAPDATIERVVRCARGNPFHLGELIRRVAAGQARDLPASLAAAARAIIEDLDSAERRVLHAASASGRTFRLDQLGATLGDDETTREIVGRLIERQIITQDWRSGATGDYEYGFAGPLLQEAAAEHLAAIDDAPRAQCRRAGC